MGMMLFGANQGGKPLHPEKASSLPISKIKSYGVFNAAVELDNIEFHDFAASTNCNNVQSFSTHAFMRNPTASDYIPMHKFNNIKFVNVEEDAMVWIADPPQSWANPTDCGPWPCTAPNNVILKFENPEFVNSGSFEDVDFQIVSDRNSTIVDGNHNLETHTADKFPSCTRMNDSAYRCTATDSKLGVLILESLDADREDREASPLIV
jgi:hypothetical protein